MFSLYAILFFRVVYKVATTISITLLVTQEYKRFPAESIY